MANVDDDQGSEIGMFGAVHGNLGENQGGRRSDHGSGSAGRGGPSPVGQGTRPAGAGNSGIVREGDDLARGWGRGPMPVDNRKYRYDVLRGRSAAPLPFSASKADRMDASAAGDLLHSIHVTYGIDTQHESRILAFDNALWMQHVLNGASMMQPGRGTITADGMSWDIASVRDILGVDARRFFRAFADDIAACTQQVLNTFDPYNPASVELVAQVRQVALERGLQKYPHLAFDAADACNLISMEERSALILSKSYVISGATNSVDSLREKVSQPAFDAAAN